MKSISCIALLLLFSQVQANFTSCSWSLVLYATSIDQQEVDFNAIDLFTELNPPHQSWTFITCNTSEKTKYFEELIIRFKTHNFTIKPYAPLDQMGCRLAGPYTNLTDKEDSNKLIDIENNFLTVQIPIVGCYSNIPEADNAYSEAEKISSLAHMNSRFFILHSDISKNPANISDAQDALVNAGYNYTYGPDATDLLAFRQLQPGASADGTNIVLITPGKNRIMFSEIKKFFYISQLNKVVQRHLSEIQKEIRLPLISLNTIKEQEELIFSNLALERKTEQSIFELHKLNKNLSKFNINLDNKSQLEKIEILIYLEKNQLNYPRPYSAAVSRFFNTLISQQTFTIEKQVREVRENYDLVLSAKDNLKSAIYQDTTLVLAIASNELSKIALCATAIIGVVSFVLMLITIVLQEKENKNSDERHLANSNSNGELLKEIKKQTLIFNKFNESQAKFIHQIVRSLGKQLTKRKNKKG